MARTLRGKVVVITGASAGIGRAAAALFGRESAHVVVAARRADRLKEARAEVEAAGGRCLDVPTDVSDRAQVQRLLDATLEHFGRCDVWVNNAGSGMAAWLEQTTEEDMRQIWETNYMGCFHGCQIALQQMQRQESGHMINVSSLAARFPLPLNAAYTATKCAVNGLTESLALELAGSGIRVSLVMPGLTRTEFTQSMIKRIPDATINPRVPWDSAEKVARRIVSCARNPRDVVAVLPAPRLTFALFDLFPGLWRAIARRYINVRTGHS